MTSTVSSDETANFAAIISKLDTPWAASQVTDSLSSDLLDYIRRNLDSLKEHHICNILLALWGLRKASRGALSSSIEALLAECRKSTQVHGWVAFLAQLLQNFVSTGSCSLITEAHSKSNPSLKPILDICSSFPNEALEIVKSRFPNDFSKNAKDHAQLPPLFYPLESPYLENHLLPVSDESSSSSSSASSSFAEFTCPDEVSLSAGSINQQTRSVAQNSAVAIAVPLPLIGSQHFTLRPNLSSPLVIDIPGVGPGSAEAIPRSKFLGDNVLRKEISLKTPLDGGSGTNIAPPLESKSALISNSGRGAATGAPLSTAVSSSSSSSSSSLRVASQGREKSAPFLQKIANPSSTIESQPSAQARAPVHSNSAGVGQNPSQKGVDMAATLRLDASATAMAMMSRAEITEQLRLKQAKKREEARKIDAAKNVEEKKRVEEQKAAGNESEKKSKAKERIAKADAKRPGQASGKRREAIKVEPNSAIDVIQQKAKRARKETTPLKDEPSLRESTLPIPHQFSSSSSSSSSSGSSSGSDSESSSSSNDNADGESAASQTGEPKQ